MWGNTEKEEGKKEMETVGIEPTTSCIGVYVTEKDCESAKQALYP